jgi:O-antigen/teichoic acid export membrane protein
MGRMRAILTTGDQALFSLSNFAVGIAIARISGVQGLGAYSFAYALWLVFQTLHRSLITDPMAINNEALKPDARASVATGLASEILLGAVAAITVALVGLGLLAAGGHTFGLALVALAPWLPFLLIQDYWRWVGFMQARPGRALANDILFDCVQVAAFGGLVILGFRSSVAVISAWGAGAAAGAIYGLWQFSTPLGWTGGWDKVRAYWPMSKWLSATSVTAWGASQSYSLITAVILGPVGLGGVRAASALVLGPALVLLQSGSSLGLPEASRALAERGVPGILKVTRLITGVAMASISLLAVVVMVDGGPLLKALYGAHFGRYSTAATIFALQTVVTAVAIGPILTLKAAGQSSRLFRIIAMQMVVATVGVAVFSAIWGVNGAAEGVAAGCVASTAALLVAQRRTLLELRATWEPNGVEDAMSATPSSRTHPAGDQPSAPVRPAEEGVTL